MISFDRLGRFVARRAWWVVAGWIALLLLALPFAPQVPGQLSAGGFILDDLESARAKALLETELGAPPSALVVVLSSDTLEAGTDAFEAAAAVAVRDVATAPHVARVVSHLIAPRQVSDDRHTAYDIVFLDLPPDKSPDALPILRERLRHPPGLDVALAGGPAFYGDVQTVSEADLQRSEIISLPLAALALLLVFGSVVAAGVPLVVGGSAVIVALAAIFVVASLTPMSIFVLNLATLLGLGLGVDYSLLLTSRFREELALRPDGPDRVADAVHATVVTAGRAVFFSGLTVLLGLLGLVLFEFMILRSVGIAGAIVVGFAVVSALTLLPAVLTIVGTRIDRLAIRRVAARPSSRGTVGSAWRAAVMRRPGRRAGSDPGRDPGPRLAVPPCPVQRSGFVDPAAIRAVARRVRPLAGGVRRGRVRPDRARHPDGRTGKFQREPRRAVRLFAPARGRRAGDQGREPGRPGSASHAGPVPPALRSSGWPTRSICRDDAYRQRRAAT